uniref:Zmp:0000000760 n=1 Tax=Poecilia reticulata TaxID=8081 RepID=A0A3P9QGY6_POERE
MLLFVAIVSISASVHCQKLPSFDLLEEFHVPESKGVKRVDGSEAEAVAYRINPSVHLQKTLSDVYPDGLPTEYSIITTFKVTNDTAQTSWNLWQVSDPEGREQVGLRFQPDGQSLDFFYTGPQGTQMVRTFQGLQKLFNREWHKLALSLKGSQVRLLIDCKEIRVESIDEPRPVIRKGYTSIVKRAARDRSASVSSNLRWCLSAQCGGYAEIGLTAGRATCKCLHGQPGLQGSPGPKGHRGLPGKPGDQGRLGNWGIRGNTGDYGNIGETGPKGEQGIKGEKGMRGSWGQRGERGPQGLKGLKGSAGFKGIRGLTGDNGEAGKAGEVGTKGLQGYPGIPGFEGVKVFVCLSYLDDLLLILNHQNSSLCIFRAKKGILGLRGGPDPEESRWVVVGIPGIIGDPGLPGRDGDPGIEAYQGPQGLSGKPGRSGGKGLRGYKGSAGKPGRPGFIGPPGPTGHVGVPGKPGIKVKHPLTIRDRAKCFMVVGDRGEPGAQGGRGKRGPAGLPGRSGPVGGKGIRGEGGPDGFQGLPGPPGPTLPAEHVIEVCKKVVLEQMSTFANSVKRTCAAVCPLYGDVPMGAPGPPGQKGPTGPPGDPGTDGVAGEMGLPGFYGEGGEPGRQGESGDRGEHGDKGVKGYGIPGFTGDQGPNGQRGRPGRAFNGQPGKPGERGHAGRPGLRGHPGLRGPPGVCVTSGCAEQNSLLSGTRQPAPQRLRNRS